MSAALDRIKASVAWTTEHRPALEQISLQLDDVRELLVLAEPYKTLCVADPAQLSALPEP